MLHQTGNGARPSSKLSPQFLKIYESDFLYCIQNHRFRMLKSFPFTSSQWCTKNTCYFFFLAAKSSVKCKQPNISKHMLLAPLNHTYAYGSKVSVRCEKGYSYNGPPPVIECMVNKSWSELLQECHSGFYDVLYSDINIHLLDLTRYFKP